MIDKNISIRRDYSSIGPDVALALYVNGILVDVVTAWHCHKHGLGYHKNNEKNHYVSLEEIEDEMIRDAVKGNKQ